jgi:hypothetical protein
VRLLLAFTCVRIALLVLAAPAHSISDPIQDFLQLRNRDQAVEIPAIKGIRVLQLDIDGDGRPETLIAADGDGGRQGNYWTVYVPQDDGFERLSAPSKDVMFREDMFYVGHVETPDGRKLQGLLAYYPGKGGGDLALYELSNGYMVKTNLGSLNLQNPQDRAFWEKYFAGPSEDEPYGSLTDHPVQHLSLQDLAAKHYDLTAVNRLNSIRQNDAKSPETPGNSATAVQTTASAAKPSATSSESPTLALPSPATINHGHRIRNWLAVVVVACLVGAVVVWMLRR